MEGKIGLAPNAIDILQKTSPTLDELLFGSLVILLLNYLVLRYLLRREAPLWRHLVVMLCSDCAFLINTFVKIYARGVYGPVLGIYGLAFFVAYYLVLYKAPGAKVFSRDILPSVCMALFYTFGVIACEGFWRVFFWGQDLSLLFGNPQVPFFRDFLLALAFTALAKLLDALLYRKARTKA